MRFVLERYCGHLTLTQLRVSCVIMKSQLLTDIEKFLAETGMSEYRFGYLAARNGRLVERLRQGTTPKRGKLVTIHPDTEKKIRGFMAERRLLKRKRRGVAA